jgi:glucosylceramidase
VIAENSGKALDVRDVSTNDGAAIQQWDYNGGANQQWQFQLK